LSLKDTIELTEDIALGVPRILLLAGEGDELGARARYGTIAPLIGDIEGNRLGARETRGEGDYCQPSPLGLNEYLPVGP
jgi:hypothetical protein